MNYIFLASGFEEIEAISVIDILRRASIDLKTVSITDKRSVTGAHGITVECDILFDEISDYNNISSLILPGGLPGTTNLNEFAPLRELLVKSSSSALLAAICAAPMVLGQLGLLNGKKATCYPGFEEHLLGSTYTQGSVEIDGNIITGNGPASAMEFGFTIAEYLKDVENVYLIRKGMLTI